MMYNVSNFVLCAEVTVKGTLSKSKKVKNKMHSVHWGMNSPFLPSPP